MAYSRPGGHDLLADLHVPDGPGPFGVLIFAHGGSWRSGDRITGIDFPLRLCRAAHLACMSIDYRLAPAFRYPAALKDVETAVAWLREHGQEYRLNGDRIVLAGESAGGHLVSLAGARDNARLRLRGVLGLSAPQDLLAMSEWLRGVGVMPPEINAFIGVDKWNDATEFRKLKEASPRVRSSPGCGSCCSWHGRCRITLVDRAQASDMCEALKKVGSSCEVVLVPGGEHRVATWPEHSEAESRAAEWLIGRTGLP